MLEHTPKLASSPVFKKGKPKIFEKVKTSKSKEQPNASKDKEKKKDKGLKSAESVTDVTVGIDCGVGTTGHSLDDPISAT